MRRTLDYYAHRAFTSKQSQTETISQWGARMDTVCGDLQRAARKHMEDLAWTNEKREGGGDIIDLFIRACFIQGLHDGPHIRYQGLELDSKLLFTKHLNTVTHKAATGAVLALFSLLARCRFTTSSLSTN